MAYDLYVLNQRLPRFPLREGYDNPQQLQTEVGRVFGAWLTETIIGNLQRRKACSQVFDFAHWMEKQGQVLETLSLLEFTAYLAECKSSALCDFGAFLKVIRLRMPQLQWRD